MGSTSPHASSRAPILDTICISQSLFDQIRRHSPFSFDNLGEQAFKNIEDPVNVYRLRGHLGMHSLQSAPTLDKARECEVLPHSLAVLPFTAGGDEEQKYLAEGLTEEIIVELNGFQKLHVASRSASFVYADQTAEPTRVAAEMGVAYVLEGSLQRFRDTVRLSLTLTNGSTGMAVWSDRITRSFEDLFDLMDEVSSPVAETLLDRLEGDAIEQARRKPPENMTAYDCMLRGLNLHRLAGITNENAREAVKWFDKAIEADPAYGSAYAWRICASSWLLEFDLDGERHFIDKALELDPNNPEAQRVMGVVEMIGHNFDASRYHHERAMALSPCDAYIKARSATLYSYVGESERALELLDEAEALDPLLPVWCTEERGVAHYSAGDYEAAMKALSELPFQTYRSRIYQCAALVELGREDEARKLMQQVMAINSGLTATSFMRKERHQDDARRNRLRRTLIALGLPKWPLFPLSPKVRPPLPRGFFSHLSPPRFHFYVVAGEKHFRDFPPLPDLRLGVLRMFEQTAFEAFFGA